MTQQDDITQRLRDNADLDEAEHGNARVVQLERDAADEIERLRAELSKLRAPVADAVTPTNADLDAAFNKAVGASVAMEASAPVADAGNWQQYSLRGSNETAEQIIERERKAYADLLQSVMDKRRNQVSAPVAGEAQPVAVTDHQGDVHWRHGRKAGIALYAAPQASAEYDRGHADGWAAGWDQAIKQPQADKDGGQQRAGDGKTREAVDYPRGGALNFDDPVSASAEGIRSPSNACMHRNECRAKLDRQQRAGDDLPAFMQPRMTPWGLLVRAGRIILGTTLMDMSKALGMRPSELSAYECDRQRLTDDVILAVMRFFEERGLCIPATAWRKASRSSPQAEQGERDA
jgi:hypothetical protein